MEKITRSKHEWVFWVLLIVPFIYSAVIWNDLPEKIATHFNMQGEPDSYSSKAFGAFIMPCFAVVLYFILRYIPLIDPRKKNYDYFIKSYTGIRLAIASFFLIFYFVTIHASAGGSHPFSTKIIFSAVFVLFALIGNFMRNLRPNFFVGIRTPWTLDHAEVWRKTHELGGKFWFYGGLAGAVLCLLLPEHVSMFLFVFIMVMITFVPVVYSYVIFRKIKKDENKN